MNRIKCYEFGKWLKFYSYVQKFSLFIIKPDIFEISAENHIKEKYKISNKYLLWCYDRVFREWNENEYKRLIALINISLGDNGINHTSLLKISGCLFK